VTGTTQKVLLRRLHALLRLVDHASHRLANKEAMDDRDDIITTVFYDWKMAT
jgi:hypothetical protein